MHKWRLAASASVASLALVLGGCGGGGSSGGGGPISTPPPAPSPSPAPGPTPTPPPPPNTSFLDLQSSQSFTNTAALGAASYPKDGSPPTTLRAGLGTATIAFDAVARAYTVTVGSRTATFRPADIDNAQSNAGVTVYTLGSGTTEQSLTITKPGTSGRFTYRYVAGAYWQSITDGATAVSGSFDAITLGFRTADPAVARTGRAEYALDFLGARTFGTNLVGFTGLGQAQIDLATGVLTINGSVTYSTASTDVFQGSATIAANSNALSGSFVLGFGLNGQISGAFYGPQGEEIGGSFGAQAGTELVAGSFLGRGGAIARLPFDAAAVNSYSAGLTAQLGRTGTAVTTASSYESPLAVTFDAGTGKYTLINAQRSLVIGTSEILPFARDTDQLLSRSYYASSYAFAKALEWREIRETGTGRLVYFNNFVTGPQTSAASVPLTGQAGYTVDFIGSIADNDLGGLSDLYGKGTLYVDFATGALTTSGTGNASVQVPGGTTSDSIAFSGSASLGSARNGFDGTFQVTGIGTYDGDWAGGFFGGVGEELGAAISATDGAGGIMAATLLGKRSTDLDLDLPTLAELTVPRTFAQSTAQMTGYNPMINYNALTITYDSAAETYSFNTQAYTLFNIPHIEVGPGDLDAGRSTAMLAVYSPTLTDYTATVKVLKPGNPTIALTYASFATIAVAPNFEPGPYRTTHLAYLFGIPTPQLQMPVSGTASYAGVIAGGGSVFANGTSDKYELGGTSSFTMDFAAATLIGTLNISGTSMTDAGTRNFGSFGVEGVIDGNGVLAQAGTFARAGGSITGPNVEERRFDGAFFGPQGSEFGGVFTISQRIPGTVTNETYLNGVTVARQCAGSC